MVRNIRNLLLGRLNMVQSWLSSRHLSYKSESAPVCIPVSHRIDNLPTVWSYLQWKLPPQLPVYVTGAPAFRVSSITGRESEGTWIKMEASRPHTLCSLE